MNVFTRRVVAAVIGGVVIAAGLGQGVAGAAWTVPKPISSDSAPADPPAVASDPNGNTVMVWASNGVIQARARSAAGVLGAIQDLSQTGQYAQDPVVAMTDAGAAIIGWVRSDGSHNRAQMLVRSANGTLSSVQTLSEAGANANDLRIAASPAGDAMFVWRRYDNTFVYRIQSVFRSSAGTLSSVQTLSQNGLHAYDPGVAVDNVGNAFVVWSLLSGADYRISLRARLANGTLSTPKLITAAGRDAEHPEVAMDDDGDALVTWIRTDGVDRIQARSVSGGTMSPVTYLSAAGQAALDPHVVIDADGDALVGWRRWDGSNYRVQVRPWSKSGTVGAVATLSAASLSAVKMDLAADSDGDARAVWEASAVGGVSAQTRGRTAGGTLSGIKTLNASDTSAIEPAIAVDATGHAAIVWQQFGFVGRVYGRFGP